MRPKILELRLGGRFPTPHQRVPLFTPHPYQTTFLPLFPRGGGVCPLLLTQEGEEMSVRCAWEVVGAPERDSMATRHVCHQLGVL